MRRLPALLLPLLLVGCAAPAPRTSSTPAPEPSQVPSVTAVPTVSFDPCSDDLVAPGTTHLAPPATVELPAWSPDVPAASGPVRLQHVMTLPLPTGSVLAGAGADAVWATGGYGYDPFPIASGAVEAQVTAAVWEPGEVPQIAWLELSFGAAPPVRWDWVGALSITTDGGDGGFWSPAAPTAIDETFDSTDGSENFGDSGLGPTFDAYLAASSPDDGSFPLCLVRATDDVVDGVVFSTGSGDGQYPTYVGYDADGRVVSVLSDGGLPWETAGVPGALPADYVAPDYSLD